MMIPGGLNLQIWEMGDWRLRCGDGYDDDDDEKRKMKIEDDE